MSKEKQCECCHEWWYDSDVKEDLCPNCYDYFKQLKQQLEEKDKEIERLNTIIGLSQLQVSEKDRLNTSVNINSLQYNQTQLAIQELEKVKDRIKHFCAIHSDEYYGVKSQVKGLELDVCESIDYQIQELKGE